MLLEEEYVEVKVTTNRIKYYESLGYNIPRRINKKKKEAYALGEPMMVKVRDLSNGSDIKVPIKCDYCGNIVYKTFSSRYVQMKNSNIKKDCCTDCVGLKMKESSMLIYGVDSATKLPETQEKMRKTMIDRYGVDNPSKDEHFKEMVRNTLLEKYGVDHPSKIETTKQKTIDTSMQRYGVPHAMMNEDIKLKLKNTIMKKYGVPYIMQNEDIKNRLKNSMIEKYGVDNSMKVDEFKHRVLHTMYKNGTMKCSRQQEYIHSIIGGKLNYPVDRCSLDIAFPEEKIYVEYDGGGHNLSVKLGTITEKEFQQKEMRRYMYLKSLGWKQIKIISEKDYVLNEDDLICFIENAKSELLNTDKNHIKLVIEKENCEYELIKL